mmetsp:Transcript_25557/g.77029  ORF Transcript_25557/g.77029 Transcript_25557/m.77029 type:complete len:275 (+) Transcript_25557:1137-1961(+)
MLNLHGRPRSSELRRADGRGRIRADPRQGRGGTPARKRRVRRVLSRPVGGTGRRQAALRSRATASVRDRVWRSRQRGGRRRRDELRADGRPFRYDLRVHGHARPGLRLDHGHERLWTRARDAVRAAAALLPVRSARGAQGRAARRDVRGRRRYRGGVRAQDGVLDVLGMCSRRPGGRRHAQRLEPPQRRGVSARGADDALLPGYQFQLRSSGRRRRPHPPGARGRRRRHSRAPHHVYRRARQAVRSSDQTVETGRRRLLSERGLLTAPDAERDC